MIQEIIALQVNNQRDVLRELIQPTRAEHLQREVSSAGVLAGVTVLMLLPELLRLGEVLEALPLLPEGRQKRGHRFRRANRMVSEVQWGLFFALVRLLPRLDPEELAQLTMQNRAYLCRAVQRSGDTSFITALFLTLASAGERTLLPLAHDYAAQHPAENVREAAQEYLHAVGGLAAGEEPTPRNRRG